MTVLVKFFGLQRSLAQTDQVKVPIIEDTRVEDVLYIISKEYPELSLDRDNILVTVNDNIALHDRVLKPQDRISFIPHIGGG